MRKFGIIAAVFALSLGTWFFTQKTEKVSSESTSPSLEPTAAPEAPTTDSPSASISNPTEVSEPGEQPGKPGESEKSETVTNTIPAAAPNSGTAKPETPSSLIKTGSAEALAPRAKKALTLDSNSSVTSAAPSGAAPKEAAPLVKHEPIKNCYTYEYRHQESAKSKDIESFLDFSNAFPLSAENVNKKSICVKVNQKPVDFQLVKLKGKEEIVIGPVVGPESIIRISYCTGAAQCRESCIPQKKRFMDDLLSDANADDFQDSWGKSGADSNSQELKAKAKELQSLAKTNSALNDRAMMRDWNTLQKQEWTCNQK